MKKFLLILSVLVYFAVAASTAKAQNPYDLPMACVGSVETYWVRGFNGMSDFNWQITDPTGAVLSSDHFTVINRGDSIQISWHESLPGGIYTFTVVEHSDYGCTGDPYIESIMLNSPVINLPFDTEFVDDFFRVCRGETTALAPGNFRSYLWSIDNSTASTYVTGEAGTYQVQLVNQDYSCTYNDITLTVVERPLVWLGNDTVLFGTQQLVLPADVSPAVTNYNWNINGNGSSIASTLTVDGTMGSQTIVLTVNDGECSNADTIRISSANYSNLRIPAAFTPNGDGKNDYWVFPAPQAEYNFEDFNLYEYLNDVDVQVFNRWGKMVWSSTGAFRPWDGKDLNGRPLPMDSYHYIIRINVEDKTFTYKGSVTIIR